jgi:hypothetical protein
MWQQPLKKEFASELNVAVARRRHILFTIQQHEPPFFVSMETMWHGGSEGTRARMWLLTK